MCHCHHPDSCHGYQRAMKYLLNCNKRDSHATLAFHPSCFHQVWKISLHIFRDDDDDDDGDSPPPGTASITSFFAPKSDSVERQRHQFFQERHLEPVDSF